MTPAQAPARPRRRPALHTFPNRAMALLHRIGRRSLFCSIALFAITIGLRVALLRRIPPPRPVIHDEFAYLLGADTFARGRLANPAHPLWPFFETMHELSHPVYASKYQPSQSAFLALGQALAGSPYAGVVLGVALMAAALYWMLRAWAPPGWALLGGAFALLTFHVNHYWMQSYWGGALAACGAALALGDLGRGRASWAFGAGAALLLFTRPYEGAALLALIGVALVRRSWRAIRLLAAAIIGAAVLFQGFYDWRITGNPLLPPYVAHIRQYEVAPVLWILPPFAPKTYGNPELARLHGWEFRSYRELMGYPLLSRLHHLASRIHYSLPGPFRGLWLAWLVAFVFPDRRLRQLAWIAFGVFGFLMLETWMMPHYVAPLIAVGLALMTRLGWRVWRMKPAGPALVVLFAAIYAAPALTKTDSPYEGIGGNFAQDRAAVAARLTAAGGRHVVIVRYAPDHSPHREWVFNGADIDAQPIVWARDRGADNARLLAYYAGRRFWLLEPDASPPRLTPY